MRERVYLVCEEMPGWSVMLRKEKLGLYATRDEAFAAAAEAARQSRANGCYAWVKVRSREATAPAE